VGASVVFETAVPQFFATSPRLLEELLALELETLGATEIAPTHAGVTFHGDLTTAYRVCLWSRIANRVLMPLAECVATDTDSLYEGVGTVPWREHIERGRTLAVDVTAIRSPIESTRFALFRAKDAIVDQLREGRGERPDVDTREPDVRVSVHLEDERAVVSLDLSGGSLHRRGYRLQGGEAPLKENLAAAMLLWAGWPEIAADGGAMLDPMCGSGTLCIEAALIAADVAPGLLRQRFGFVGWRQHRSAAWDKLLVEAKDRANAGTVRMPRICGFDANPDAVHNAIGNVERANLTGFVHIERRELASAEPLGKEDTGLVAVNPPYGERMGEASDLQSLYTALGGQLKRNFAGWQAVAIVADDDLGRRLGLQASRRMRVFNGKLPCRVLDLHIRTDQALSAGGEMLQNRLRKNFKHLSRWAKKNEVSCFRVYDADLPEYAAAIDRYEQFAVVQEYEPPKTIPPGKAARRLQDVIAVVPDVLGIEPANVIVKVRRRQRGTAQYGRLSQSHELVEVAEGQCRFLVNLRDYVDTGLFLDGRLIRRRIAELSLGRRFLNLFAYTGTATVYAARGGAVASTSVDLSSRYLRWARRNLELNGFGRRDHELIEADCGAFVAQCRDRYGLIYMDPPTFSRSKKLDEDLDIQRDHIAMIQGCLRLLTPDGVLLFSTHSRHFDLEVIEGADVQEITRQTVDEDFARGRAPHRCWQVSHRSLDRRLRAPAWERDS